MAVTTESTTTRPATSKRPANAPEGARGSISNAGAQPKFPATKVKTPLSHFYRTLFIQKAVGFCDNWPAPVN
jgi:hypothetical protein